MQWSKAAASIAVLVGLIDSASGVTPQTRYQMTELTPVSGIYEFLPSIVRMTDSGDVMISDLGSSRLYLWKASATNSTTGIMHNVIPTFPYSELGVSDATRGGLALVYARDAGTMRRYVWDATRPAGAALQPVPDFGPGNLFQPLSLNDSGGFGGWTPAALDTPTIVSPTIALPNSNGGWTFDLRPLPRAPAPWST